MEVPFGRPGEGRDKVSGEEAGGGGRSGRKGHRSAGGLRASVYNAFPVAGCEALASLMGDFARAQA